MRKADRHGLDFPPNSRRRQFRGSTAKAINQKVLVMLHGLAADFLSYKREQIQVRYLPKREMSIGGPELPEKSLLDFI